MKDQTSYDAEIFSLQLEEREKTASLAGRHYDVTPRTPGHATRQPKQEVYAPRGMTFPCSVGTRGDEKSIVNKVNLISTKTQRIHLNYYLKIYTWVALRTLMTVTFI